MKTGERSRFKGTVRKCEKGKDSKKISLLLVDLEDDHGKSITDYIWIDLLAPFDFDAANQTACIVFEASVKKFHPNSYYDYHERERVTLRPTIELNEIIIK